MFIDITVVKFQFVELNGHLMWCDFGANLVRFFTARLKRYATIYYEKAIKSNEKHVFADIWCKKDS